MTGDLCREIEAVAHDFSRHFTLEYLADGTLVPDTEPPGWPPPDPRDVELRAGSVGEQKSGPQTHASIGVAIAYGGAQLDEPPPLSYDAILTQLVAGFGRTPALLDEMAAYWLILVHRMRHKVGRGLGSWLDTVAEEYAGRRNCRRQRHTCCA